VNPAKFLCGTPKICDEFLHAQRASKWLTIFTKEIACE
jgi:hypothetical protein